MTDIEKKCAHPPCECEAREDSEYCSDYCEQKGIGKEILCHCGHEPCQQAVTQ